MSAGRRVAAAAIAALLLVGAVIVFEVVLPRRSAEREALRSLLLARDESPPAYRIERPDGTFDLKRRPDGAWDVVPAAGGRSVTADVRLVTQITRALQGSRVTSRLGPAGELRPADHGLDPPRCTLSWRRPSGREWTLGLAPSGVPGQAHGLADGEIVLVPARVLEAADHPASHFRLRRVLELQPDAVVALDVERRADALPPGASTVLRLRREPATGDDADDALAEWRLAEPLGVQANPVRLSSLLSRLATLEAKAWGPESPGPEELAATGLAVPAATLALTTADGRQVRLLIGDPTQGEDAWARVDDGPVAVIRSDVARDALLADDFWRDNRVVKVPRWRMVNLQLEKKGLDFEIAREPGAPWRLVRPADAEVPARDAEELLDALDDVLCGRFEDELAADPAELSRRYDFLAPGSLRMQVLALMSDGTPRRADVELTPFLHEKRIYFAARVLDEMGRLEACVVLEKNVDRLLAQASAIAGLGALPGSSGPAASGPAAPRP